MSEAPIMSKTLTRETSNPDVPGDSTSESNSSPMVSGSLAGLLAALVGGVLVWLAHWAVYPVFFIPAELSTPSMFPSPELIAAQRAAESRVDVYHAMLVMSFWGAVVGSTLSVGEFMYRRSRRGAVRRVAVCGLTGALVGCLAGILGQVTYAYLKWQVDASPSTRTICVQGLMLAVLGGGVGLGFGTVAGRARAAVSYSAYGFLAGILAGILYPFLAVSLLPPRKIDLIIPYQSDVALLWIGLSSALIGLLVTNAAQNQRPVT